MDDAELEHPTWDEIDALAALLRARETYLRAEGTFHNEWDLGERLESLVGKLRRNFHRRNRRVT